MLLPSVAISIAINYLGTTLTPVPTTGIVLTAVLLPSSAIGLFLWLQGRKPVDSSKSALKPKA